MGVCTVGLAVLTWPRHATGPKPLSGAAFGLLSGLFFGFCLNAYRHAVVTLDPGHPVFASVATISLTQAAQAAVLTAILAWRRPQVLEALFVGWKESLIAGFCGATASAMWLLALASPRRRRCARWAWPRPPWRPSPAGGCSPSA